jgi:hypothetical protein
MFGQVRSDYIRLGLVKSGREVKSGYFWICQVISGYSRYGKFRLNYSGYDILDQEMTGWDRLGQVNCGKFSLG